MSGASLFPGLSTFPDAGTFAGFLHPTTAALFAAIGPGMTVGDDGTLLAWLDGAASLLGEVDDVVRDDVTLGWAAELTADRTHRPRWTAQLLGVEPTDGATDADVRTLIRNRPSFRRGTIGAIVAAAKATLTGSQYVNVIERDASPYRLRVQTFIGQTPNPAATLTALLAQKPGGLILTHQVIDMTSYAALEAEAPVTYSALATEPAQTYTALET